MHTWGSVLLSIGFKIFSLSVWKGRDVPSQMFLEPMFIGSGPFWWCCIFRLPLKWTDMVAYLWVNMNVLLSFTSLNILSLWAISFSISEFANNQVAIHWWIVTQGLVNSEPQHFQYNNRTQLRVTYTINHGHTEPKMLAKRLSYPLALSRGAKMQRFKWWTRQLVTVKWQTLSPSLLCSSHILKGVLL